MSNGNYQYQNSNFPEDPLSGSLPQEQIIDNSIPLPADPIEPINGTNIIENRFETYYPVKAPTIKEEDTEEYKKKVEQELERKKKEQDLEKKKIEMDRKKMESEKLQLEFEKKKIEEEKLNFEKQKAHANDNYKINSFNRHKKSNEILQIERLIEDEQELESHDIKKTDDSHSGPEGTLNWETIRNIAALRGVIFIIISLLVSFSNYGLISISSTAGYVLLGISIPLLMILTTVFNSMTKKIEDNCFLRFLFLILFLIAIYLFLLSIEYYKTAKGSIFFYLFVALSCSALGISDVLTIIYTTVRKEDLYFKENVDIKIHIIFLVLLCGVQFILSMICTGNWWFLLLYFIVLVFSIYFVVFMNLVNQSKNTIYNYPIYGVTKSFSHLFGGLFFIPLNILSLPLFVILIISMKICSCEPKYNDFRKKLIGDYTFSKV